MEPKTITLAGGDGKEKAFILHKIPAIPAREIIAKYPISILPKIGDYQTSEETMLKLMSYVEAQKPDGGFQRLITRDLVNSHVDDCEMLLKLEWAMMEFNYSFFKNAGNSTFWADIATKSRPLISKILTDSLGQLLPKGGPRSTS